MKKTVITAMLYCIAGLLKVQAQAMPAMHESLNYVYAGQNPVKIHSNTTGYAGKSLTEPNAPRAINEQSVGTQTSIPPEPNSQEAPVATNNEKVVAKDPRRHSIGDSLHNAWSGIKHGLGSIARVFRKKDTNPCPQF